MHVWEYWQLAVYIGHAGIIHHLRPAKGGATQRCDYIYTSDQLF